MTLLLQGAGLQVAAAIAPADPIGDTLRADAVVYWKMDEASGQARISSKGSYDLVDHNTVPQIAGKISNAALATALGAYLDIDTNGFNIGSVVYAALWVKIEVGSGIVYPIKNGDPNLFTTQYALRFSALSTALVWYTDNCSIAKSFTPNGNWHFIECYYDSTDLEHGIAIAIDNGAFTDGPIGETPSVSSGVFEVGADGGTTGDSDVGVDELGLWTRKLNQTERDYLYNSGAGRALFPAP